MVYEYCYNDCYFTFEDEVNENSRSYGINTNKICSSFNAKLIDIIHESKNIKNQKKLIWFKNKWDKIIRKHIDNMSINNKNHDESCFKVIEHYYECLNT